MNLRVRDIAAFEISDRARRTAAALLADGYALMPSVIEPALLGALERDITQHAVAKTPGSDDANLRGGYPSLDSFRRIVETDDLLAVATLVCGDETTLRSAKGTVRSRGGAELLAHTDTAIWTSSPFRRQSQMLTMNIACGPVSAADGATFFVPGSHRLLREPTRREATELERPFAFDARPGDVVCWIGETWHGRFSRTSPGERLALLLIFASGDLPTVRSASYSGGEWQAHAHHGPLGRR